jgi:dihydropteroate synthase
MGVLNVTPDSFSDGGRFSDPQTALQHALVMVQEGAAIIDVGGESTRPGAAPVSASEEMERVVPIIEALAPTLPIPLSVDTSKPEVMQEAVRAGAGFINDVRALQEPGALEMASELGVPVCLMHMGGLPRTMQNNPQYDDVVSEVHEFLKQRVQHCVDVGIPLERLVIDPGFGFGKTLGHNLSLLKHLQELSIQGLPILVGMSRKSMIGLVLDAEVDARLYGSLAVAAVAAMQGVKLIRVHDVKPTVEVLKLCAAVVGAS